MFGRISSLARFALLALALPLGGCGVSSIASRGPALSRDGYGLPPLPRATEPTRDESIKSWPVREAATTVERKVVFVASSGRSRIRANDCPACRLEAR
jgi:hypothetical protein